MRTRTRTRNRNGDKNGKIDWKSYGKIYGKRVIEAGEEIKSRINGERKSEGLKERNNKIGRESVRGSTSGRNGESVSDFYGNSYVHEKMTLNQEL